MLLHGLLGDFNGHVGKKVNKFEGVHARNGIGEQNFEGRMLFEFCDHKDEYMVVW